MKWWRRCTRLWDSWEAGCTDPGQGIGSFPLNAAKVHRVDYDGRYVKTRGPLTVPQDSARVAGADAGRQSSPRGREFAARWAEIESLHCNIQFLICRRFGPDISRRGWNSGDGGRRSARSWCQSTPLSGKRGRSRRKRQAYLNDLVDARTGGLALISAHIGDRPVPHYPLAPEA